MSMKKFKQNIKKFGDDYLVEENFFLFNDFIFRRELSGFYQGVEFLKGTKNRKDMFTINLYWTYTNSPLRQEDVMHYFQRIGQLISGYDEWFSYKEEDIDASFSKIKNIFLKIVIPMFNKYNSIDSIMKAFEAGIIEPDVFFGVDKGWKNYNIGYNYLYLGEKDKAKNYLLEVINKYSNVDFDWVQERFNVVQKTLSSL